MSTPLETLASTDTRSPVATFPGDIDALVLDPEIKKVMRRLHDSEHAQLRANIVRDGPREPLCVWLKDGQQILLDGYNRYPILKEHRLPFLVTPITGLSTIEDAVEWVINNQLGRRNLSDNEVSNLRGTDLLLAEKRQGERTDRTSPHTEVKLPARQRQTSAAVARKHHVSPATIERDAQFARALNALAVALGEDYVRTAVLVADSPFTKTDVIALANELARDVSVVRRAFELKRTRQANTALNAINHVKREDARRLAAATGKRAHLPRGLTLFTGDFRDVILSIPGESVDLIFTDPPYNAQSVPLYTDLAREAARVLKPGGSLIAYAGHYALPTILPEMARHLRFWWLIAILHSGGNRRLPGRFVYVGWKPAVWFVKGTRAGDTFLADTFHSAAPDKMQHDWAQSGAEARYYIEHLTLPGGTVLDPFAGSGTTLYAALALNRRAIGIDIDPDAIARIRGMAVPS